ncbi:hypothetical protein [Aquipseudomonas campi]
MATPTKKQIAGHQRRSLRAMSAKLQAMAREWDDVDQFCVNRLTEAAEQLDDVAADLTENAEAE